jgi:hypothetical protein
MDMNTVQTWLTYGSALVVLLLAITPLIQKFVDLFPDHQEADTVFGALLRGLEIISGILATRTQNKFQVRYRPPPDKILPPDEPAPGRAALAPAPAPRVQGWPPPGGFSDLRMVQLLFGLTALGLAAGFLLPGCAGVAWGSPVFTAGPTVSPIEEITLKTSQTATTAGFSECVGLGQFDAFGKNWDSLDLCAVEVGGIVNVAGTPGVLQLGPEIGTFNNIIGAGFLFTPYTADGQGFFQGGGPGFAVAGMFNITAITAWLAPAAESDKMKLTPRLPRGGLGGN